MAKTKYWSYGCVLPGTANASTNDRSTIERTCSTNPHCKGFYANDVGSWFIASDEWPRFCNRDNLKDKYFAYPTWYSKVASQNGMSIIPYYVKEDAVPPQP